MGRDIGLHMALAQRFYFRQGLLSHAMGFAETLFDPMARYNSGGHRSQVRSKQSTTIRIYLLTT